MTQTQTATNKKTDMPAMNGALEQSMESDLGDIKADLSRLKDDFGSLFDSIGKAAKAKSDEGVSKGGEVADRIGNSAKETQDYVEGRIKERPLAAIGLALGAGFLVAKLSK